MPNVKVRNGVETRRFGPDRADDWLSAQRRHWARKC